MSGLLTMLDGNNGARADWIRKHLDYPNKDWCLIWPFDTSDTGYALFGSPPRKVSRLMCEYRHGLAPTPEHHAAHSCDRGHDACVNPWHLDWKTPTDNQIDRRRNGKYRPRKLTPDQAREIRDLKGLEHTKNTAARFGVRESNVRLIQSGKTWREEAKDRYFLSDADVLRIRAASRESSVVKALAAEYGVSTSTICRVRDRKSYQFVEDSEPTPLQPASPHSQAESAAREYLELTRPVCEGK